MRLHCEAWKSDEWWIAQCLEICIVAQGRTLKEAQKDLKRLIHAYLEDCVQSTAKGTKVSRIPPARWYWLRLARWYGMFYLDRALAPLLHLKERSQRKFLVSTNEAHA